VGVQTTTKIVLQIITGAYEQCAEIKVHNPPINGDGPARSEAFNTLHQRKSKILNSMRTATKEQVITMWREVHSIQKQMQAQTAQAWKTENSVWWQKIGELDDSADASEFWQLAQHLKHKDGRTFPTVMEDDNGGSYRTKTEILDHIKKYYCDISNNIDTQASDFYNSRGMTDTEVENIAATAANKARTTFRKNEQREPEDSPCDNQITWEEFNKGIDRLRNKKSPGKGDIPSEALKHLPEAMKRALLHLVNMMWSLSVTPTEWNTSIMKLLHKTGSRLNIKNYRPITLLTSLFKMWEGILESRVRIIIEGAQLPNLQMGSSKQNSSAYTIMAKKCLIRLAKLTGQPIITLQIDMNKAYNRVCRDMLWAELYEFGIRGRLLKAIVSTYKTAKEMVRIGGVTSSFFTLLNGLRQGSVLSPVLYILYTVKLIRALEQTHTGLTLASGLKLPCLMFVDDLATFTNNMDEVILQLKVIHEYVLTHKGVLNMSKSGISTSGDSATLTTAITESGVSLKVVEEYVHLGAKYKLGHEQHQMRMSPDVRHRLAKGRAMLSEMKARGLGQPELHQKATLHIIHTRVAATATYGISSMDMTTIDKMALDKLLSDGIRLACQWSIEEQENVNWIILESNLIPMTILTLMNDVAAWIRALKGKINPLIKNLFEQDDKLHAHIIRTCNSWQLTIPKLMSVKDDGLYNTMRVAYNRTVRMQDEPKELERPCSKTELGIHLAGTALERVGLDQKHCGKLMRLRSILRHAHQVETEPCVYCNGDEHHTVSHVVSRCSFPPTKRKRQHEMEKLSTSASYYLTNMSTPQLAGVTGGPLPDDLTLNERGGLCEAVLAIFATSPLFQPQ
jgi:hypothetical protein